MFTKASLKDTGLKDVEKLKLTGISTGVNLTLNTDPEKLAYYAIVDKADYDKATEVRVEKQ